MRFALAAMPMARKRKIQRRHELTSDKLFSKFSQVLLLFPRQPINRQRRVNVLSAEKIKKAAVIGSGAMGHGITQLLAMNGIQVSMVDINDDILAKAKDKIKWSLGKFAEKKRIRQEDADAALARITTTTSYEQACKDVDGG